MAALYRNVNHPPNLTSTLARRHLLLALLLAACGGSGGGESAPSITINVPTAAATYATTFTDMRLGGTIAGASFVHVINTLTGSTTEGFVNYNAGQGSWFADVTGLGLGENPLTVTADVDGTGTQTATARITIVRPLQPADDIFNGPSEASAATLWTDSSSFNESHKIALFADGTGKATTGSALAEDAGTVSAFSWTKLEADVIQINGCATCSFQNISRISGSANDELFYGQIETVGGAGETALHAFILSSGNL